jgi:hypothetical protein
MSLNNTDGAELARAKRMLATAAAPDLTITQVGNGFTSAVIGGSMEYADGPAEFPLLADAVRKGLAAQAEQPGFTDKPFKLPEVARTVAAALTPASFDLEALLDAARANMKLPSKVADGELPAADPELINALVARADEYKRTSDLAVKERAKITALLKEMVVATRVEGVEVPAKTSITVHGAPVFVVNHVVKRELDQAAIKAKHPDIAKWALYWKESSSDTGIYK